MPDSLKNDIVSVDYIAGEQPTHAKLTESVAQLRVAIGRINKALGDLYSEQTHTGSSGSYDIDYLPSVGPNLSRFIGSVGWLNPRRFSRTAQTLTITFAGHSSGVGDPPTYKGYSHYNRREFKLPFPPVLITSGEGAETVTTAESWSLGAPGWTIGSPGGGYTDVSGSKVVTRVATLAALNASGEYHVSSDGIITTYDAIDDTGTPEAFTVTYQFHMIPDRYDGASLNVIPDFSQTTTLCSVSLVSGTTYQIVLPTSTSRRARSDISTWTPPDELRTFDLPTQFIDPQYGDQLLLPYALRANLSNGDVIPDGYICLWNETTNEIVSGLTFTYVNTSTIQSTGVALTLGSATYRVIVPGTTISQTISTMAESQRVHDHSGRYLGPEGAYMGDRVRHPDLLNNIDEGSPNKGGFVPSAAGPTRQPHPMLLHRYGYQFGESLADAGNLHNAMMGDLVFTNTADLLSTTAPSYSIYFGEASANAARIYYHTTTGLSLLNKDVYIEEDLLTDGGVDATLGVGAGADLDRIRWTRQNIAVPGTANSTTVNLVTPGDVNGIQAVHIAVLVGGVWYLSDRNSTDSATHYLWVQSVASGATIDVTYNYGTSLRGASGTILVTYY